jgi:hypothetical protein
MNKEEKFFYYNNQEEKSLCYLKNALSRGIVRDSSLRYNNLYKIEQPWFIFNFTTYEAIAKIVRASFTIFEVQNDGYLKQIFITLIYDHRIFILKKDELYYQVNSPVMLINETHKEFCFNCLSFVTSLKRHRTKCSMTCIFCCSIPRHEGALLLSCIECRKSFINEECYANHLSKSSRRNPARGKQKNNYKNNICNTYRYCKKCNLYF